VRDQTVEDLTTGFVEVEALVDELAQKATALRSAVAVGVVDAELGDQGRVGAEVAGLQPEVAAGVPTGTELGPDRVVTRGEQARDVVLLGLDALVVVGRARRQGRVTDLVAVDAQLVDAAGRGEDAGRRDGAAGDGRPRVDRARDRP